MRGATESTDIAATRTYLRARHGYEQAIKRDGPADQGAAHALVAQVTAKCPNVLAGAASDKATEEITREAGDEAQQALESAERGASIAFGRKIERLRWSNRQLTYYVRGFAVETRETAEIVAPDLCTEARAVAASDYKAVPASTTRYVGRFLCAKQRGAGRTQPRRNRGAGRNHPDPAPALRATGRETVDPAQTD
jgi:hypothetical protein